MGNYQGAQPYTYSGGYAPRAGYRPPAGYRVAPAPRRYPSTGYGADRYAPPPLPAYRRPPPRHFGYGSSYGYAPNYVYGRRVQPLVSRNAPTSLGGVISSIPPTESFNYGDSGGPTFGNDVEGVVNGVRYYRGDFD